MKKYSASIRNLSYDPNTGNYAPKTAPVATWVTATAYSINDEIIQGNTYYQCTTAHTSGTFATDYTAGNWNIIESHAPLVTKTAAYTMTSFDRIVEADGTAGSFTVTLPIATATNKGLKYTVKVIGLGATFAITVATQSSQTIDGLSTKVISTNKASIDFISNGTNFDIA
jgi:hypothetical protein